MDAVPDFRYKDPSNISLGGGMAHNSGIRGALGLAVLMATVAATPAAAR